MYKIKRTWSHNDLNYIPGFRETFPELKHIDTEELCDRFCKLNVDFFEERKVPVKPWLRLTLPFALILLVGMFLYLPINFMINGYWGYKAKKSTKVYNWLNRLNLIS